MNSYTLSSLSELIDGTHPGGNSETRFLIPNTPDVMWVADSDNYLLFIGDNVEVVTGYNAEQELVMGQKMGYWVDRIHPTDVQAYRIACTRLLEKREAFNMEYQFKHKNGDWIWIHDRAVAVYRGDGKTCASGFVSDVTSRKQAEITLKDLKEKYESLIKNIPDVVYVGETDGTCRMSFISERYEQWTGYTQNQLCDDSIGWLETIHPKDREREINKYVDAYRHHEQYDSEYRVIHAKTGQIRWIRNHVVPIIDNGGKLIRIEGIMTDISDQVALRDSLRFYASQLTSAQEDERQRMARDLHDGVIQNLFSMTNSIGGLIDRDGELSKDTVELMRYIQSQMDFTMEEIRRFCNRMRPALIDHLGLIPALELLVKEVKMKGLNATIEVKGVRRRLPPDRELALFRICQEAINNVMKHADASKCLITLELSDSEVKLRCVDNGKGFSVPRLPSYPVRSGKLGLFYMCERVDSIGGEITIESVKNKGTEIQVVICM